jgi:hypothetical protein
MLKTFKDFEIVELHSSIQSLKTNNALKGRDERIMGYITGQTQAKFDEWVKEYKEGIEALKVDNPSSEQQIKVNSEVSKSFLETETKIEVPEIKSEWFDDYLFGLGTYDHIKKLFSE